MNDRFLKFSEFWVRADKIVGVRHFPKSEDFYTPEEHYVINVDNGGDTASNKYLVSTNNRSDVSTLLGWLDQNVIR